MTTQTFVVFLAVVGAGCVERPVSGDMADLGSRVDLALADMSPHAPVLCVGGCRTSMFCPVSGRSAKTAIRYLTAADLETARARVLTLPPPSVAWRLDVYDRTWLAVAALQAQRRSIAELRRQVQELRDLVRG